MKKQSELLDEIIILNENLDLENVPRASSSYSGPADDKKTVKAVVELFGKKYTPGEAARGYTGLNVSVEIRWIEENSQITTKKEAITWRADRDTKRGPTIWWI